MSDDEDLPQLSAKTFAALQEFYKEQEDKMKNNPEQLTNKDHFEENWMRISKTMPPASVPQDKKLNEILLSLTVIDNSLQNALSYGIWQLSQFWYDEDTIERLVKIAVKSIDNIGRIALISCPSLYKQLRSEIFADSEVTLFEFDSRFNCFGSDFIEYDYKYPLQIPRCKEKYYDLVIADPPFLSDECLTNTAVTIQFLAKERIILCTGAIMSEMADKLLKLKSSNFIPKHKNNLANEFRCYTNFNINDHIL